MSTANAKSVYRMLSLIDKQPRNGPAMLAEDLKLAGSALWDRWWIVLATLLAALLTALCYIWLTPPLYTATAQLLLDPRKRDIVKNEIVPSGLGTSSLGADTFLLDSQVMVMSSNGLRRELISRQKLEADTEFAGSSKTGALQRITDALKSIVRGPQGGKVPDVSPVDRVLGLLDRRLEAKREGNTYIISVRMTSADSEKSARIANAFAQLYIDTGVNTNRKRVEDALNLLSGRLKELRDNATKAQQRLETFRSANGLVGAGNVPVNEQQLQNLNNQLTLATAATSRAKAKWLEVARIKDQPFETAIAAGAVQSEMLASLQLRYVTLSAREAQSGLKIGHPDLTTVREAKAVVRQEATRELARLVNATKAEGDVALANETSLRASMMASRSLTATTNQAAIKLKELEQEAQAAASIHQDFLARSNDAREQVQLPIENARVISWAHPPTRPSWPLELLLLGAAGVIGLILGSVLAFIFYRLNGPRPRSASYPES